MTFKVIQALAFAVALCGCSRTVPTREITSPVALPPEWNHNSISAKGRNDELLSEWWKQFKDPVLDTLITTSLNSSPDIQVSLSRIAEFRSRMGVHQSNLSPTLDGNLSGATSRTKNLKNHTSNSGQNYGASLDAQWQVDLFGRNQHMLTAAAADLAQSEDNYHGAQVSLASEVAFAYINLRSTQAQERVIQNSLLTRVETTQLTVWREKSGLGSVLETQQALGALEQSRASLPTLQKTISETRNQLALLSGLKPGAWDDLLSSPSGIPSISGNVAVGIPADTLRQRPDVRAAQRALAAAISRSEVARLERYPDFRLTGSIGVEALKAGHLFNPNTAFGNLLGGLTVPIFNSGRINQTIAIQDEQEQQATLAYKSSILTALSEVENALVAMQSISERIEILSRAIAASREVASLTELQYKAGRIDLSFLLDAQRTLLNIEQQQVTASAEQSMAYIQLYRALGGGWSNPYSKTK